MSQQFEINREYSKYSIDVDLNHLLENGTVYRIIVQILDDVKIFSPYYDSEYKMFSYNVDFRVDNPELHKKIISIVESYLHEV